MIKYIIFPAIFFQMQCWPEPKSFVFVTASFNNISWYENNLASAFSQDYPNWRMIYINDCSTDQTGEAVQKYIKDCGMENKITYIANETHRGHLENQYNAIHSCRDDEIIVILDGDDWLAHASVLQKLNDVYQDPNVWLTYGSHKKIEGYFEPSDLTIPEEIVKNNAIREFKWVLTHVRTFYAGLYKLIKEEDLKYNGAFLPVCVDLATMFPMFEMAGGRYAYINEILLYYNNTNPLAFHTQREYIQAQYERMIRSKPKYQPIESFSLIFDLNPERR